MRWNMTKRNPLPEAIVRDELESFQCIFVSGNEAGLFDALRFCQSHSAPVPPWALDAMVVREESIIRGEYKRQGKWRRQFRQDMIDMARAEGVEECLDHGTPWKVVYEVASKFLEGTDCKGKPDAIAKSYKRYTRNMKTDPRRYYLPQYIRGPESVFKGFNKERAEWILKTFPGGSYK